MPTNEKMYAKWKLERMKQIIIFSQMTRNDAQLVVSHTSTPLSINSDTETQRLGVSGGLGSRFNVCDDISGSCSEYYTNSIKYYWIKGVVEGYTVISRIEF